MPSSAARPRATGPMPAPVRRRGERWRWRETDLGVLRPAGNDIIPHLPRRPRLHRAGTLLRAAPAVRRGILVRNTRLPSGPAEGVLFFRGDSSRELRVGGSSPKVGPFGTLHPSMRPVVESEDVG